MEEKDNPGSGLGVRGEKENPGLGLGVGGERKIIQVQELEKRDR